MAGRARGTSAGLDRARIAAAAVALIDRDGLERFGVRPLAGALGVDPMSIYHHVKGKAALLDAASEAVLGEVAELAVTTTTTAQHDPSGWQELARNIAHAYRDMAYRHPRVFPLLVTRAQTSPVAVSALESLVAAMRRDGLPDRVVADAPMVLFGFLNGHLLARTAEGQTAVPAFDPQTHPAMAALAPGWSDFGSDAELDRMLDIVLAGLAGS
ncbi:TetR/AcrR family transcriptional regulator C-terminal domain-containing protein [Isoptericola sp. NEAU-Y5]|uniref:TetR/AcrR family transcriptional regulator C-terminal domain-containing protein n=1 Tax=Isoptericola luteus TaxID=2879484 RepID=A0ABS7ZGN8_9MICO|nr:TetR/AcrR family transcriptional regulator C-terminal domain-containing protein [Isoptericola sp. NEAU-Y5]MCA5894196.1 TetR/AcrR family transcriptional regulator C-terminal domain-containing protein [Isoptericola sp. NEAU-Y5]